MALYNPQTEEITFPLALKNGQDVEMPPRKLGDDEFSFVIRYAPPGGDGRR